MKKPQLLELLKTTPIFMLNFDAKQLIVLLIKASNFRTSLIQSKQILHLFTKKWGRHKRKLYTSPHLTNTIYIYIYIYMYIYILNICQPVDTGSKSNVHKTFRRHPRGLLNVLCTFNLRPVSTGTFLR